MLTGRKCLMLAMAVVASLSTAWYVPTREGDDDAALRKKALSLNNVTGDDPIKGEIKALVEDPPGTKKLLAVAAKMAREKNQPFNYNGAFILGNAALTLRDAEAGRALFRVCFEQAAKVRSPQKMSQAYLGMEAMIDLLYLEKKYDQSAKAAQEFLEVLEKLEQEGLSKALKSDVLRRMVRAMAKEGKSAEATRMVDNLIKVRPTDWRNYELRAYLERENRNYSAAIKAYEQILPLLAKDDRLQAEDKEEKEAETRLNIVDVLSLDKKYDRAVKAAQELLDTLEKKGVNTRAKEEVLRRVIRAMSLQGNVKEASKMVEKLGSDRPGDYRNSETKAWMQRELGNDAEAAKLYQDMLERVRKDDELDKETKTEYENDIRYMLSGIYIDLDQVDKAVGELETLLKRDPDNPSYNNDLGYVLADHDRKLPDAEKLIRKAIDLERAERKKKPGLKPDENRDNAAYLDSLGWVLFKMKKYDDAKKYLQQAAQEKDGQHVEILDHLADVHLVMGEKAEAVKVWKKALTLETKSKREKEKKVQVEKKLKANQ
jgi:tetratricopeptide (TPR) repeat protein